LVLVKASEGYRPLFLLDGTKSWCEITDIHFYTAEGIKFSLGHGWFDIVRKDGPVEGERRWCYSPDNPNLDFHTNCTRKVKVDYVSKGPFFVSVTKPDYKSRGRFVELYLPFDMFNWAHQPDFSVSQHENGQTVYDLWGIEELGVGLTVEAGEKPTTREQAQEEEFAVMVKEVDPEMAGIYTAYRTKVKERKRLEKEVEEAKARLEAFGYVSWIDGLLKPIGEAMLKRPELKNRWMDILGPSGIGARTSLHFYKNGVPEAEKFNGNNCLSIKFEPDDICIGKLRLVDTAVDTKEFKAGTVGEMNGLNHPLVEMPKSIEALVKWTTH
jgi:hypothetical protein